MSLVDRLRAEADMAEKGVAFMDDDDLALDTEREIMLLREAADALAARDREAEKRAEAAERIVATQREHLRQRSRKEEAYDAARAQVKREGFSRAEYILRAEVAERRVAALTEALTPFARDAEAFRNAESAYGGGPVFERMTSGHRWFFTVADVRRAAVALAGSAADATEQAE